MKRTIVYILTIFLINVTFAFKDENVTRDHMAYRNQNLHSNSLKSDLINEHKTLVDSTYTYMYPFSPDSVLRYKQRYAYDKQLNLILEESLTMGSEGKWIYQSKNEYAFDNRGNLIERTFYNTDTGEARISSREKIEYNSNNNIIIHYWYMYDETIKETVVKDEIKYNKQGNWIEIIRYAFNYETNEWEYVLIYEGMDDESGNILEMKHLIWDKDNTKWVNYLKTDYEYDGNNRKTAEIHAIWKNEDWTYIYKYEWEYDENELGSMATEYRFEWSNEQEIWEVKSKNETTENEFGIVLENRYNWSTKTGRFENYLRYVNDYNNFGNQILSERYKRDSDDDPWTGIDKTIWEYNQKQQLNHVITFAWDNNTSEWINDIKREYNLENNIALLTSIWADSLKIWLNDYMITEYYNQDSSLFYDNFFRWDGSSETWTKNTLNIHYQSLHQDYTTVKTISYHKVKIYPNPCTDIINWKIPDNEKINSIQIFSQTGKLVKTIIVQTSNSIDVSDLSPGIYFISFIIEDKAVTNKILIE